MTWKRQIGIKPPYPCSDEALHNKSGGITVAGLRSLV
jgi:hypothetical protein